MPTSGVNLAMERRMHRLVLWNTRSSAWALAVSLLLVPSRLSAQAAVATLDDSVATDTDAQPDTVRRQVAKKTFFVKRVLPVAGGAAPPWAAVGAFARRVARGARSRGVRGDSSRHDLVEQLTR